MRKKGKKNRINQLEVKYDLLTKEMQDCNIWKRKHLKKHTEEKIKNITGNINE